MRTKWEQWTPDQVYALADRMAARIGRGFSVTPLTARLVVVALRHYADGLAAEIGTHAHPYQVRLWGSRGELVAELAVCNDLNAARGAFDAASSANPRQLVTLGQQARSLCESGPRPLQPAEEKVLMLPPPIAQPVQLADTVMKHHRPPRQER